MPRSKRVGVLTFHRCINYGSYWQARCLVEGLREAGEDAVLLDHRSASVDRAEWRCALDPCLPRRAGANDRAAYARKTRAFLEAAARLPLSAPFPLDTPEQMEPVDVAVVGSDEVWNLRHPWYAGREPFFGAALVAECAIAYAGSFGNHDAADGLPVRWTERLSRFSALSVRDDNSRRIIVGALGYEPPVVLDPCLLFAHLCRRHGAGKGPVLIYGHSFPEAWAAAVRRWADATGRRLLSIGYRNSWAHEHRIEATPEDFAQAFGRASAVVTNFFHGCVFALIHDRPFAALATPYRANKIGALLTLLGLEDRLLAGDVLGASLEDPLSRPPGPTAATRLAALRRSSRSFLQAALG